MEAKANTKQIWLSIIILSFHNCVISVPKIEQVIFFSHGFEERMSL